MSAVRAYVDGRPVWLPESTPDPELALSMTQKRVMAALRAERWSRAAAARRLGVSTTTVQMTVYRIRAAGVDVPPGHGRGRDLRPRKGAPARCGQPVHGSTCGRGQGHAGGHRSLMSCERDRVWQRRYDAIRRGRR